MVNGAGDSVIAFSGSKSTEHIGAFYTGMRANGAWPPAPILVQAGKAVFSNYRWGDYSHTTLDPTPDGMTFWTVQEAAGPLSEGERTWETWIARIQVVP